jgi:hypothetical protein
LGIELRYILKVYYVKDLYIIVAALMRIYWRYGQSKPLKAEPIRRFGYILDKGITSPQNRQIKEAVELMEHAVTVKSVVFQKVYLRIKEFIAEKGGS